MVNNPASRSSEPNDEVCAGGDRRRPAALPICVYNYVALGLASPHGHRVFGDASLTCSDCPGEISERGHRRDLSFTMTFKVTAKARNVHSAAADQGKHWP